MPAQRPQDLVFTLFGDYLLHRPGATWVGSLLALLGPLGLSEAAGRTVLSRMGAKGWLEARRRGRRSYYDLTPRGRLLLEKGEARLYHPPVDERWDGEWSLVAYSVPEDRRHLRDRLRVRLQWLGYGQMRSGVWISPHRSEAAVRELAAELGVAEMVDVFRGGYRGVATNEELVARCWDLAALAQRYRGFLAAYEPERARLRAGVAPTPEEAYVRRFWLVHEYREFPLLDPYLPPPLLPEGWPGGEALALFDELHALLSSPAEEYVESVLDNVELELVVT